MLTLTDYRTGNEIRPATRKEFIRSAYASGPGGHTGAIVIDGRSVYVSGHLLDDPTDERIATLRTEAGEAGDLEMVAICDAAIDGDVDARIRVDAVLVGGAS